jgi:hypothetical protein
LNTAVTPTTLAFVVHPALEVVRPIPNVSPAVIATANAPESNTPVTVGVNEESTLFSVMSFTPNCALVVHPT